MSHRTVKQARTALQFFVKNECGGKTPKAINTKKFIEYVAAQSGWDLKVFVISNMNALRGILLRNHNNKSALMLVSEENTHCWARFTSIKEVCHLFLTYEEELICDNALEMAQALVLTSTELPDLLPVSQQSNDKHEAMTQSSLCLKEELEKMPMDIQQTIKSLDLKSPNPHGVEETSAIVAAIEIMIPENHRGLIGQMASTKTLYEIANEFKVPRVILEYRLTGWGITPQISTIL